MVLFKRKPVTFVPFPGSYPVVIAKEVPHYWHLIPFRLTNLPQELCELILEFAVRSKQDINLSAASAGDNDLIAMGTEDVRKPRAVNGFYRHPPEVHQYLQLRLTSRKIREDVDRVFYRHNVFLIGIEPNREPFLPKKCEFVLSRIQNFAFEQRHGANTSPGSVSIGSLIDPIARRFLVIVVSDSTCHGVSYRASSDMVNMRLPAYFDTTMMRLPARRTVMKHLKRVLRSKLPGQGLCAADVKALVQVLTETDERTWFEREVDFYPG